MSNFLGEVYTETGATSILSTNELLVREGVSLQKGMNFRKGTQNSVFLVLPSHDGKYTDEWHPETDTYVYEGHDSTTIETRGTSKDQLLMYAGDKLTENGKFYKAAQEYKDRVRKSPVTIQVYEKLDPGVWYDKGVFDLTDARTVHKEGRKIFKFDLQPFDLQHIDRDTEYFDERMMSVVAKIEAWKRTNVRCNECGTESGLRFVQNVKGDPLHIRLLCTMHRGEVGGLLG